MSAPFPSNESERLRALVSYGLLDSPPEPKFDQITALASFLLRVPIALLTLLDKERLWLKSRVGFARPEIPRPDAFCAHTILSPDGMVVRDASRDDRFADNPLVRREPWVRFYAGMPLVTREGHVLGTLCVLDIRPRDDFDREQRGVLNALAGEAMAHAELHRSSRRLASTLLARKQSETQQMLHCRIVAAIAVTSDVAQALQVAVEQICEATGWTVGRAWAPGEEAATPFCCKASYAIAADGRPAAAAEQARQEGPGCGSLAERAWREGRAVLRRRTDPGDGQNNAELEHGGIVFEAAAAFTVAVEENIAAVLEFLIPSWNRETEETISRIAEVASRLGTALQRKGLDERLRHHEAELSRANRIKDDFLAMLAHELRNPLAPILNAVELLRTPNPGDAVEVIERQVWHMSRLMEDLLDISRVNRGKITVHKKPVDLAQSVRAAIRTARSRLANREQPFSTDFSGEKLWVAADPVRIEQIVTNLLNNAVKYTDPGSPISLSLKAEGGEAVLKVRDRGIGIVPEMQGAIFEPFVQSNESLAMTRGGLGLGLALVRQLVEMHGGKVGVRSDGPGLGSEFFVRLPLIEPPPEAEKKTDPPDDKPAARRRILVVEDNVDLAGTLTRLLVHWGHTVERVTTGTAAFARAAEFAPDVALIDIGLPGMDGYAVAERLSSAPEFKGMLLIAITGYGQEADRARAAQAGFHDYLLKPVDPALLKKRLAGI